MVSSIDTWLRRALLAGLLVLVMVGCFLLWRLARAVHRVEQTAALASVKIEELTNRITVLEEKGAKAVGIDDLEATLDRMGSLRDDFGAPGSLDPQSEEEIKHLLATIRTSGLRFEAAGENDGATQFYLKGLTKYHTYKRSLRSTEDFIDKLAGQSMSGDPYMAVFPDGSRRPVTAWLTEALAAHRAEIESQPTDMAGDTPIADPRHPDGLTAHLIKALFSPRVIGN